MNGSTEIERRGFVGVDKRNDRTLVGPRYLLNATNMVLDHGVLASRKGDVLWGNLNADALPGTYRSFSTLDVGGTEWCLLHKGNRLYAGQQYGAWQTVTTFGGGPLAVTDAESDWQSLDYNVGSGGVPVHRVRFKQAAGCRTVEFDGTTWFGLNAGIKNTASIDLTINASGAVGQPVGAYRLRVAARRMVNGLVVSESASCGRSLLTGTDDGYLEFDVASDTTRVTVSIVDPSDQDPQITHYVVQVTRPLVFVDGTEFSANGNDPTLYFEAQSVAASSWTVNLILDLSDLAVPCPDLFGYEPIAGHLMAASTGAVTFFAAPYSPSTPYQSRIYYTAIEGGPQHRDLYDPSTYIDAAMGDGKLLTGLGILSDHLVVFKENKTGLLLNRDVTTTVIWRDQKIGIPYRKCFANISEEEVIALCHDGIVRRFNGNSWDRKQDLADGGGVEFSEAIRTETKKINPQSVEFVFHDERLHMLYSDVDGRKAWVLHPRDGMGWMPWDGLHHVFNAVINNGLTWIYLDSANGSIYEQSPEGDIYTLASGAGGVVEGTVVLAHIFPENRKNTIELWRGAVEGEFARIMSGYYRGNQGETAPVATFGTPDPELPGNEFVNWFEIQPQGAVWGNHIEHGLTWRGKTIIRSWNFEVQETDGGGVGWSSASDTPGYQFLPSYATNVLLDLRFDQNSGTVHDYSGHRRHHEWEAFSGGARVHQPNMIPGGGQEVSAGVASGFGCMSWDGLDNFTAGLLATAMTHEYEVGFDSLAQSQVIHQAGNGTEYWRILVNTNGSLEYQVHTSQLNWRFTTPAGALEASNTDDYFVQFVLSNGGNNGQFYCGPRIGPTAPLITTRSNL